MSPFRKKINQCSPALAWIADATADEGLPEGYTSHLDVLIKLSGVSGIFQDCSRMFFLGGFKNVLPGGLPPPEHPGPARTPGIVEHGQVLGAPQGELF